MRPIAKAHGTSVARVALAYVMAKSWVSSVIIGARTEAQLNDNLEAGKLKLEAGQIALLDQLSALPPEYPVGCWSGRPANACHPKGGAFAATVHRA